MNAVRTISPSFVSPTNGQPLLRLVEITKRFGGLTAVNKVNLDIYQGDLHFLIGPNGAGKSTLFKTIVGYHKPESGRVIYKGTDISYVEPFLRARMGLSIKFQTPSVYPDLTVSQNMVVALNRHRFGVVSFEQEILDRLHAVGLHGIENMPAGRISHGQRQWLEIALALAVDPEILLLDEPNAGMTPDETARTASIIRELNDEGMTIIVIAHDMEFVRALEPKITVLHLGKVFTQGQLSEIERNEEVQQIYLGKK
ncbi:MAG: ABC transporter ATP-binding protein [Firmicutes bacterium]|nr:ABC transporter ATP-binding protein [Bacillota bacterium]